MGNFATGSKKCHGEKLSIAAADTKERKWVWTVHPTKAMYAPPNRKHTKGNFKNGMPTIYIKD